MARPKEGPRAPLFYGALVLIFPVFAGAQTVEVSNLERCAALETQEAKLACFEALVPGSRSGAVEDPQPDPAAPSPVIAEAPAVVSSDPPAISGAASDVVDASVQAPAPTTSTSAPPVSADDEFGQEHLASRNGESEDVLSAKVVDVTKDRFGALIFHLDNGQVWRQMEARYFPYPKDGTFDVVITTGMMGEYRLQVGGAGRKVTIRRTK